MGYWVFGYLLLRSLAVCWVENAVIGTELLQSAGVQNKGTDNFKFT